MFVFSAKSKFSFICRNIVRNFFNNPDELPKFITTPVFYVNSVPHIGHLYTTIYADALFRFRNLIDPNKNTIFSTGTDEHGLKIQKSAEKNNEQISDYCNRISQSFHDLFKSSNVSFTNFIRTTNKKHEKAVIQLWNVLCEKGLIYKSVYKGYYSVNDETFVPQNSISTDVKGNKVFVESGHLVEWHEEENYLFKLSSFQNLLNEWYNQQLILKPENFRSVLNNYLKDLKDISVSRPKTKQKWGIGVPNDDEQVIYVWFDALINYLTVAGYPDNLIQWPPCHVIGKDIMKFHCIYWPAFLMAADIEPPRKIYCHSHWLINNEKMSKSKGNVVAPQECISKFSIDGIRYFLLKNGTPHSDSNFNMDIIKICLNADLANTLGNLFSRCTSEKLNCKQMFYRFEINETLRHLPECTDIINEGQTLAQKCFKFYISGDFYMGIALIMNFLRSVNSLFNLIEPWKLLDKKDQFRLEHLLFISLESIRISGVLLQPIVPSICESIFDKMNLDHELRTWKSAESAFFYTGHLFSSSSTKMDISKKLVVFPKL